MRHVVRRIRRHIVRYVEVVRRRAHLADGVIQRMVGRHRRECSMRVRMIRGGAEIPVGEIKLGQRFTWAAVVGRLSVAMVLLRLAVLLMLLAIVVLGMLRVTVLVIVALAMLVA